MIRINTEHTRVDYPALFPTIGTTMGYSSAGYVLSLAESKGIKIKGTDLERVLSRFDTNTPLEFSNCDGRVRRVRSLGFVMLGNRGEETLYLGISSNGSNIDDEIPIATQRSNRTVTLLENDSSIEIIDQNGHGSVHYTIQPERVST